MAWFLFLLPLIAGQEARTGGDLRSAVAAHQRGDLADAVKGYRQVLEQHPDWTKVRINLGAALAGLGRLDEAIFVFESAPARDRGNPEIGHGLTLAYYRANKFDAAARELETLAAARPLDINEVSLLADCYLRMGAPSKALAVLEPAAKLHPDKPDLAYQLGMALVRSHRPNEGLEQLERAGKLGHGADAYLLAGGTALDLGQFQRARADLETALRLNPNAPGVWTWAGMARDRVSDEDGAKAAFHHALHANPRDFEANLHLGAILYREREMTEARVYLERALEIQPSSPLAQYSLALNRSAAGDIESAVRDLEALVNTNPNWVEPHVKLASLYFRLRRQSEGRREQDIAEKLRSERREEKVSLPALDPR